MEDVDLRLSPHVEDPEKVELVETIATLPGGWDLAHAIRLGIKPFAELGANSEPLSGSQVDSPCSCRAIFESAPVAMLQSQLVRDIIRTANLVRRHIKREELAKPGRLDFQHPLGVICLVEGQDVKAEPVPDRLSDPLDLRCEVVPTHILESMAFQVVNELLSQLAKLAVCGILLCKVDLLPLPGKPGFIGVTGSDESSLAAQR